MREYKRIVLVLNLMLIASVVFMTSCKKPPRASFTYEVSNGGLVQFRNTSAGKLDRIHWSFGDTVTSSETNPLHRYLSSGVYQVRLDVENSDGKSNETQTVTIIEGNRENLDDHPQFIDADGYFYARNVLEYETATPTVYNSIRGSAVAAFYDSTNFLVSVGRVSVNGIQLTNNADNSYSFHSPDSSMYFKDETRWTADGGNGFSPIVENIPKSFPELQGIIPDTFNTNIDTTYILKVAKQILFADSVIWKIENSQGLLIAEKHTGGGVAGAFFEKEDLTLLTLPGTYVTKVVAYSMVRKTSEFKVLYYTKESYTESTFKAF